MRLEIHNAKVDTKPENDLLLITGDGRSLNKDLDRFLQFKSPHDVMSIGRSINVYPGRVRHWANVDGPECIWWAEHLPPKNDGKLPVRHTLGDVRGYDVDWDIIDEIKFAPDEEIKWHGTSSLFAVHVGLALGYGKIVLAGCPMDMKGHWFFPDDVGPRWNGESFIAWMEFAKTPEAKKVQSLSGYTKQILSESRNLIEKVEIGR